MDDSTNDAKTEGRTPHAMLLKAFSQMIPYWHNYEAYVREYGELTNIKPETFCNFPGIVNGKIQYMLEANPKAEICAFMNGKWIRIAVATISSFTEPEEVIKF